jgi:hypothetical protein
MGILDCRNRQVVRSGAIGWRVSSGGEAAVLLNVCAPVPPTEAARMIIEREVCMGRPSLA